MTKIKITLYDKNARRLFSAEGEKKVHTCIAHAYEEGDYLVIQAPKEHFIKVKIEEAILETILYAKEDSFVYQIPFGEARSPYPEGTFLGTYHIYRISLEEKNPEEHDLSTNPLDVRGETGFYPHCIASVETRGESVFAARNTIDGYKETDCHGYWPYTSWGDNENPEAEITIHFGREIRAARLVMNLRADYPHDNYWKQAELVFSDGSTQEIRLEKTGEDQVFELHNIISGFVTMRKLIREETLSSPFPALTYWAVYGTEQ